MPSYVYVNYVMSPPQVRIVFVLDQAVADFENGLDSILTNSVETPKLDASFDKPATVTSSLCTLVQYHFS